MRNVVSLFTVGWLCFTTHSAFAVASRQAGAAQDSAPQPQVIVADGPLEVPVPPPAGGLLDPSALPTGPPAAAAVGEFVSVQVNTNAQGQNIVGDAANEPSIGVDPTNPDRMVAGWRHFRTVGNDFREAGMAYSHDGGLTWTFPGVLQPGQFRSDPVLDTDNFGTFYYYSLSTLTTCEMFISDDGGVSWSAPIPARGGDKNWLVVDKTGGEGDGHLYCDWNISFSCCNGDFTRSSDGGSTYTNPARMPNAPKWGSLAVAPDGTVIVAGATQNQQGFLVSQSQNAKDANQNPSFVMARDVSMGGTVIFRAFANPAGLGGQLWVDTPHPGGPNPSHIYLLASVDPPGGDSADVMFVRSTDDGNTWSAPIKVNDDAGQDWQWFGTMSVAPNGRIDAVWNDSRNSGQSHLVEVYYSYSIDGGLNWSRNQPISPSFNSRVGWPVQQKIGDYYHMRSDDNAGHLIYSATFNNEEDVYYLRITPDCNENGVHDGTDILEGASTDCNGNGIPDDCEEDPCGLENVPPESFEVTRGVLSGGGIDDLLAGDDAYVRVEARRPTEVAAASAEIVVSGTLPVDAPAELWFTLEAATSGDPVRQRIELFNFETQSWERLDERDAPTADTTVNVRVTDDPGRFVEDGSGAVRARIGYHDRGVTFPAWGGRYDQTIWRIVR
jgi:hypothetical protein